MFDKTGAPEQNDCFMNTFSDDVITNVGQTEMEGEAGEETKINEARRKGGR